MAHPPGETLGPPQRAGAAREPGSKHAWSSPVVKGERSDRRSALRTGPTSSRRLPPPFAQAAGACAHVPQCGTLESVNPRSEQARAHERSAAFFAPETRSHREETPPWMMSLSIRRFFGVSVRITGRESPPHALAERRVDELMALHAALAANARSRRGPRNALRRPRRAPRCTAARSRCSFEPAPAVTMLMPQL